MNLRWPPKSTHIWLCAHQFCMHHLRTDFMFTSHLLSIVSRRLLHALTQDKKDYKDYNQANLLIIFISLWDLRAGWIGPIVSVKTISMHWRRASDPDWILFSFSSCQQSDVFEELECWYRNIGIMWTIIDLDANAWKFRAFCLFQGSCRNWAWHFWK